ncbi:MAG: metallophosphoesterase [Smithella sp.]
MNIYAFVRLNNIVHFSTGIIIIIICLLIILTFAPLLARMAEKNHLELLARAIAYTGYVWMAFIFVFFCLSVFFDIIRLIFYLFHIHTNFPLINITFGLAVFLSLVFVIYGYVDARIIRTKKMEVVIGQALPNGGKIRIVQISDIHVGLIVREKRLQNLIDKIKEAEPDLLISTGDFVDGELNNVQPLTDLFKQINPKFGKYAIPGNHEYYAGIEKALHFTRLAGFDVLRDEAREVAGIKIIGLDDVTGRSGKIINGNFHSKTKAFSTDKDNKFLLLLRHQPYVNRSDNFNLQLSGHTHNGQIYPFRYITRLFFKNNYGYYELEKNKLLYVSGGAGTWGPPVRIFAPPEITVIDLIGQKTHQ